MTDCTRFSSTQFLYWTMVVEMRIGSDNCGLSSVNYPVYYRLLPYLVNKKLWMGTTKKLFS